MIDPGFREAEAVERRRVDIAAARIPGGLQRRLRVRFGDGAVEIAQRRGAEAKLREFDDCARTRGEAPYRQRCFIHVDSFANVPAAALVSAGQMSYHNPP